MAESFVSLRHGLCSRSPTREVLECIRFPGLVGLGMHDVARYIGSVNSGLWVSRGSEKRASRDRTRGLFLVSTTVPNHMHSLGQLDCTVIRHRPPIQVPTRLSESRAVKKTMIRLRECT